MTLTPLEIVAILWAIVTAAYLVLFLIRSVVGMHEEDNLYLSAGEARLADEQVQTMKRIDKWSSATHKVGYAALAMTLVLAVTWCVNVFRELF